MFSYTRYFLLILASVFSAVTISVSASPRVEVVATDFNRPWSITWINETQALVSERSGQLIHLISLRVNARRLATSHLSPQSARVVYWTCKSRLSGTHFGFIWRCQVLTITRQQALSSGAPGYTTKHLRISLSSMPCL